jgi:FkbM family methyltransferase
MKTPMNFESREFAYIVMDIIGRPQHVVEVGTYDLWHLQTLPFVFDTACRVQLFEPQPLCVEQLREFFDGQEHIEINQVALGAEYGQATLCVPIPRPRCAEAPSSAFLDGIASPYGARAAAGHPEELEHIRVEIVPISEFDDGTIQALAIDTEGYEWQVLQTLISRPWVISVEMKGLCGYVNPHKEEIENWMQQNKYVEHYVGKTDVIYVRSE